MVVASPTVDRLRLRPPRDPRRRRRDGAPTPVAAEAGSGVEKPVLPAEAPSGAGRGDAAGETSELAGRSGAASDMVVFPSHDARSSACGASGAASGAAKGSHRAPSRSIH